jgi:hypothetical protein
VVSVLARGTARSEIAERRGVEIAAVTLKFRVMAEGKNKGRG